MPGKAPTGQVEIFCRTCGRSCGYYPAIGWSTVTHCISCQMGDGFNPASIGLNDDKFLGRDVGTTIDDLKTGRPVPEVNTPQGSGEPPKEKKRTWMKKQSQ